jgi:hypothetical protein
MRPRRTPSNLTRSIEAIGLATTSRAGAAGPAGQETGLITRWRSDIEAAIAVSHETGDRRLEMAGLVALGGDARVALGLPIPDAIRTVERGLSIATMLSDRAAEANLRARLAIYAVSGLGFDEGLEQGRLAVRAARHPATSAAPRGADGQKASVAYLGEIDALMPIIGELEPLDPPSR